MALFLRSSKIFFVLICKSKSAKLNLRLTLVLFGVFLCYSAINVTVLVVGHTLALLVSRLFIRKTIIGAILLVLRPRNAIVSFRLTPRYCFSHHAGGLIDIIDSVRVVY